MRIRAIAIAAAILSCTVLDQSVHALPISQDLLAILERDGEVTSFYSETVQVDLAPSDALTEAVISQLAELSPDVGIEALFRYRIAASVEADAELDRYIYNVMRSFGTMEGIPYYSASRGRMRTFFYESYVVESAEDLGRRPDPVVATIPQNDSLIVFQRDSSFGKNTLSVTYQAAPGEVMLSMSNLTTMAYRGVLPVVRPQNLQMFLYVVRVDHDIYFYGNCGVNTFSMFGMEDRAQASFTNRIRALYSWFATRMAEYP